MIFDTDVLIWASRGNQSAQHVIDNTEQRAISLQTYLELLQKAPSKKHQQVIRRFLLDLEFKIIAFTEKIGHRAAIYIEEYSLKDGISIGDALIAATAVEESQSLITGNYKHFKCIPNLSLQRFSPGF